MTRFTVPTRDQVSESNQAIFDNLKKALGFVPNLYATFAHSEHALGNYLAFQNAKSSLNAKQREVVNLVVSEVNACTYCLAAHTALGKMNGFGEAQILELRDGRASFDPKLDALAKFAKETTEKRGHPDAAIVQAFLDAGWTQANLVDAVVLIGDKTVSNYLHGATQVPVDFPPAKELAVQ
ncbi:MAG: carboxymuconolactone decarboxylase family protein [Burkholderiales bacterium]